MLTGHETADFSSIQISALVITDHNSANYYLAYNTSRIEPLVVHMTILGSNQSEREKENRGIVLEGHVSH